MIALAVGCAALAAWLWAVPSPHARVIRLLMVQRTRPPAPSRARLPVLAGLAAAIAAFLLVGGVLGLAAAVGCVVLVPRLTRRLESGSSRRRRADLERAAPDVAELLAATLASGAAPMASLSAVADAVGEPARGVLRPVLAAMELGAAPGQAWRSVDPAFRPVADAVVRSARSGAPLAGTLRRIAEDLRRDRQQAVEVAARAAGVRAVAPLAACFLPAFVLVGVVPVVVSLATGLLG